ncbi:hypothetical protein [Dongia sp.]|uniref:hypothetical protein n=1 Tax=Dongia sp. TaxID=1977262 RepID=UPI0035B3B536
MAGKAIATIPSEAIERRPIGRPVRLNTIGLFLGFRIIAFLGVAWGIGAEKDQAKKDRRYSHSGVLKIPPFVPQHSLSSVNILMIVHR